MPAPPTGTITFLFTDIESSTLLWERDAAAMEVALARHDAILREAIAAHGGHVFKTMGDQFCAAFTAAPDALAAAVDAQRNLRFQIDDLRLTEASHGEGQIVHRPSSIVTLRVRMALHTGIADERDGDYFGQALNRLARILDAGHGGQILLSLASQALVREHLLPTVSLRDLGEHRLKDLAGVEHIYQAVVADLPADFPPLRTLNTRPNNLVAPLTPLVGRERELALVSEMMRQPGNRLVTLTGPGGIGKTRLALHVAAELLNDFADGVFFVNLGLVGDASLVVSAIAQALDVRESQESGRRSLLDLLLDYVREKDMLLVLDNFEQVVEAAPLVADLLGHARRLKVMVTSRVPLHIRGEREFPVPTLSLPDAHHLPSLDRLSQYSAVELFIERAVAIKPDFHVTNESAPAIAEICARLDGLPLAIELAAARIRTLSPQALLQRLSSRLNVLTGGARDLPERQRTLRNAIEWSYDLLDTGEQALFRRLGVFAGGCTFEMAEAVVTAAGPLPLDVLDGVGELVAKSLLRQLDDPSGETRFSMLETIREYALERLALTGEAAATRRAHAEAYRALAEAAERPLEGPDQLMWLNRLEREHDNLRAAIEWAVKEREPEIGLRLVTPLGYFWTGRGYWHECYGALTALLDIQDRPLPPAVRAKALWAVGTLQAEFFDQDRCVTARRTIEAGLAECRRAGPCDYLPRILPALVNVLIRCGDLDAARALLVESEAEARRRGDRHALAQVYAGHSQLAQRAGDYEQAQAWARETLALVRQQGDRLQSGGILLTLAIFAWQLGDYETAHAYTQEAADIHREFGNRAGLATALNNLGVLAVARGDYPAAHRYHDESLALLREFGNRAAMVLALHNLGYLAHKEGDDTTARPYFKAALQTAHPLLDRHRVARSIVGLATVALAKGCPARAARLYGAAAALDEATSDFVSPDRRADYAQSIERTRAALGDARFTELWRAGRELSLDQAVAAALDDTPGV